MSYSSDPPLSNSYQFPRWSPTLTRPPRISSGKKFDDAPKSTPDYPHRFRHTVFIPTERRTHSPPLLYQPAPTPDLYSVVERASLVSSVEPPPSFNSVRIQSATLTVPPRTTGVETVPNSFAKESHERRKVVQERRLRKQQVQKYVHVDSNVWLQLRQSSAPLKRLTAMNEDLIDSNPSRLKCEKYSFEALKEALHQQQNEKRINTNKFESDSRPSSNHRSRATTPSSTSHARFPKRPTETFPQPVFEPFIVAAKPIHPLIYSSDTHSSKTKFRRTKPPPSAPPRSRQPPLPASAPLITDQPTSFLLSDESPIAEENPSAVTVEPFTRPKTASTGSIKSTIKLVNQVPRCRSANDTKSSHSLTKTPLRFILITDDEHRIESWYHRYPFIIGSDFLQSFQLKSNPSIIPAFFTDNQQQSFDLNRTSKGHLQDKPFHRELDWKKYDLILISQTIYTNVIAHLQSIVYQLSKSIQIRPLNQQEDLKTQVTRACQHFNQESESHL